MDSNLGYTKPLYILAFDHRLTFAKEFFNKESIADLTKEEYDSICEFKDIIYDAFKKALEKGVPKENAAILADEEFGNKILLDGKSQGFITILPTEKSGGEEFNFQYQEEFGLHIEKYDPVFAKALVRYNPRNDESFKNHQKKNLKILSDYCRENKYKFLLEVLVIPTPKELEESGSREEYDKKIRPGLTAEMIKELQDFGVEPDIWKLEGMETAVDYSGVIKEAKSGGRDNVGIVILGRGAEEEKVEEWLTVGARTKGIIGFAVGRTIFWDAISDFKNGKVKKEEVTDTISNNFYHLYKIFQDSKNK